MSTALDFSKSILCIVTGASRGIGRAIALDVARKATARVVLIILARSEAGLNATKAAIIELNPKAVVFTVPIDLGMPTQQAYDSIISNTFAKCNINDFEIALVVHNVGHVGALTECLNLNDTETWRKFYDLNVFSIAIFNSVVVKHLKISKNLKIFIVNITSLCGRQPFKDMALYGSSRAARALYFEVLALEEPDIVVLNYSPGPVDTDLLRDVTNNLKNLEMKTMFEEMFITKKVLTAEQSVEKLTLYLKNGSFKSGATLDYYDE